MTWTTRTKRTRRRLAIRALVGTAAISAGSFTLAVSPHLASGEAGVNEAVRAYAGKTGGFAVQANVNAIAGDDPALSMSYGSTQVNLDTGSPPILIDAHAINNFPGTLAGAAVYTPGSALQPENTPGYAEAFYPQPADKTAVRKCAVNNEQKPAEECQQSGGNYYAEALADPKAAMGPSSSSIATATNTQFGENFPVMVGNATTTNLIGPDDKQQIITRNVNSGGGIVVPNSPIEIKHFEARSEIIATKEQIKATASCTIDIAVNGQPVPIDQAQAAVAAAQVPPGTVPLVFQFTAPTAPKIDTSADGATASCTGAMLRITDSATGSFVEYTFGSTSGQGAKSGKTLGGDMSSGSGVSDLAAGQGMSGSPGSSFGSGSGSDLGSGLGTAPASSGSFASDTAASSQPMAAAPAAPASDAGLQAAAPAQPAGPPAGAGQPFRIKKVNAAAVGGITAAAATLIGIGLWLLIGVVRSLARFGTPMSGWAAR